MLSWTFAQNYSSNQHSQRNFLIVEWLLYCWRGGGFCYYYSPCSCTVPFSVHPIPVYCYGNHVYIIPSLSLLHCRPIGTRSSWCQTWNHRWFSRVPRVLRFTKRLCHRQYFHCPPEMETFSSESSFVWLAFQFSIISSSFRVQLIGDPSLLAGWLAGKVLRDGQLTNQWWWWMSQSVSRLELIGPFRSICQLKTKCFSNSVSSHPFVPTDN